LGPRSAFPVIVNNGATHALGPPRTPRAAYLAGKKQQKRLHRRWRAALHLPLIRCAAEGRVTRTRFALRAFRAQTVAHQILAVFSRRYRRLRATFSRALAGTYPLLRPP